MQPDQRKPYILVGSPELLRALVQVAANDPEIDLLSVVGPPQAPERLIALMPTARADLLRLALAGHLLVEPDELLAPPDDPVGPAG